MKNFLFFVFFLLAATYLMGPIRGAPSEERGMLYVSQMVGSLENDFSAFIVRVESGGGVLAKKDDFLLINMCTEQKNLPIGFESGGGVRAEETVMFFQNVI